MAKIKIISNPYQKVTVFQSWDDATAQWVEIDRDQNADSQLLREELCVGFFPFKAKQIVDVIIHEYSAGSEKVEIVFEGTDDEYLELDSICSQDDYPDRINLYKSGRYLENARDILPDVSFEASHASSFDAWMRSLMATIIENIVEFSPQLHEQAEIIREETARIADLESRMIKLNDYTEQIRRMMDWKEA